MTQSHHRAKRTLDVAVSLLVLTMPIRAATPLVAIRIRLGSPVLFRQTRLFTASTTAFVSDLKILRDTARSVARQDGISAAGHAKMPKFPGTGKPEGER